MTTSSSLTDLQHMLLTAADQREGGSLLPLPEGIPGSAAGRRKELQWLIGAALAAEVTSTCPTNIWRKIGRRPLGLVITDAGRAAIAAQTNQPTAFDAEAEITTNDGDTSLSPTPSQMTPSPPQARNTKSALVLEMLRRESGATLNELSSATNWLPHTTRAALTGLRKKGHGIEKRKRGEVSCYHLGSQA